MFEWSLGIMAFMSALLHLGALPLCHESEMAEQQRRKPVFSKIKHPTQKICGALLTQAGSKWGKTIAMDCIGAIWALFYVYHFMIGKLFHMAPMLNLVNIMTTVLTSIYFLQVSYKIAVDFDEWCTVTSYDILTTTVTYWELILAGIVLIHLIFQI